ncbi:UNVERIFIED_CONTAM: hypothetical protein Scaly_1004600 [Sesamum calycinum]|uniref:Uncharacterized protein n=1 Tax=Sesamum calycinum TaxID=2727403 RepID=A0AAW2QZ97_9LAMI
MVSNTVGPSYFASSHESVPDDGTRSCFVDAGPSSYCYGGGGLYDYDESGLEDHFSNAVHAADQSLCDGCTQSQLGVVAELVDIKEITTARRIWVCPLRRFMRVQAFLKERPTLEKSPYAVLRYLPLTPRLQRLYSSRATAEHMTWHATYQTDEGSMCHPSDAEAWKHFDRMYLILQSRVIQSSSWYVHEFRVHVSDNGDQILDRVTNISPAVEMPLSLADGYGSDHKWTKKSIFGDLPYWSTLLIRYNLDVMHIEKNMFNNRFNTVMDIKGKTNDSMKTRRDLKIICNRLKLELDKRRPNVMPKTVYTLRKEQKRRVCEWIRGIKIPDGYASNLARCVDMTELRLHGMKSHDYHVFI